MVHALNTHDYSGKTRVVRINGVATQWCLRDMIEVVTGAGKNLDCIMVPKVEDAAHAALHRPSADPARDRVRDRSQDRDRGPDRDRPAGHVNLNEIATATDRIETLIFGPGDYAANIGVAQLVIGSIDPDYPGDQWHYVISADRHHRPRLRAAGDRRAVHRHQGHRRPTARCATAPALVGFDGKWVLHPSQVDIANEVFMPTQEQFDAARRLLDAYHHATQVERKGAVMHEGQMIDEASRKIAAEVVTRGEAAGMSLSGAGS